jgi:hypothetical protein
MIHDFASHGTYEARHALYSLIVPESGASLITIAGEAKTIAKVILAPGDGLSRRHRSLALAHPHDLVCATVRGDWQRAPSPADFDPVTLRWMIDNATDIAVWSAPWSLFADEVARWGIDAANNGARFLLTIDTVAEKASVWAAFVRGWMRRSAALTFFGPGAGGAQ